MVTSYWSGKLGKKEIGSYQTSERGRELILDMDDKRVYLTGPAVTVIKYTLLERAYFKVNFMKGKKGDHNAIVVYDRQSGLQNKVRKLFLKSKIHRFQC